MTILWPSPDAVVDRATTLYAAGRAAEALAEVEAALPAHPDYALLHVCRAQFLVDLDRVAEAVEAAEEAVSMEPELGIAHTVRAQALLAAEADTPMGLVRQRFTRAGKRREQAIAQAVESAADGVRFDPDPLATFTLVEALLKRAYRGPWRSGRREDLREAEEVAGALAAEWPTDSFAPLALAIVSMARARAYPYTTVYRWWYLALMAAATGGSVLVWLLADWLNCTIRGAPHLRRADRHLRDALALEPHDLHLQVFAAELLRMRFRFVRAVDYEVSAAALDAGLVDADEVVAGVARRATGATVAALVIWGLVVSTLDRPLSVSATGAVGFGLALLAVAGVTAFRHYQAKMLPAQLRLALNGRIGPVLAATATTATLADVSHIFLSGRTDGPRGYWLASLLALPLAAVPTLVLIARFVPAWRAARSRADLDARLADPDELVAVVARRLTKAVLVALGAWYGVMAFRPSLSVTGTAVAGVGLALAAMAGVVVFRRRQTKMLPAALRPDLDARAGPVLAAAGATIFLAVAGSAFLTGDTHDADRGYQLAGLLALPLVALPTLFLLVRFVRGRRLALPPLPRPTLQWMAIPLLLASAGLRAMLRRRAGGPGDAP